RVACIKTPIRGLRFDPVEHEGAFTVVQFHLEPIEEKVARALILARLGRTGQDASPRIRSSDTEQTEDRDRFAPTEHLHKRYHATFDIASRRISDQQWIDRVETRNMPTHAEVRAAVALLQERPRISIVMPVYETKAEHLCACIDSVITQS